jgi:glutamyl-tRNA synthetase
MSLTEMVDLFSLDRVSKHGAKFDQNKAKWFNQQYVRHTDNAVLAAELKKEVVAHKLDFSDVYITRTCELIKEKISFVKELWSFGEYFFIAPKVYDAGVVAKRWNEKSPLVLQDTIQALRLLEEYTATTIEAAYNEALAKNGVDNKDFMQLLRVCLSGVAGGPPIFEMAELFGKHETINRLQHAMDTIKI